MILLLLRWQIVGGLFFILILIRCSDTVMIKVYSARLRLNPLYRHQGVQGFVVVDHALCWRAQTDIKELFLTTVTEHITAEIKQFLSKKVLTILKVSGDLVFNSWNLILSPNNVTKGLTGQNSISFKAISSY